MIGDSAGTMNPVTAVLHALYASLAQLTGIAGITPLQLAEGAAALVALLLLWQLANSLRGREAFTLDEDEGERGA